MARLRTRFPLRLLAAVAPAVLLAACSNSFATGAIEERPEPGPEPEPEIEYEIEWRLAEWGLSYDTGWTIDPLGDIWICWDVIDKVCPPAHPAAERFDTLDEAIASIDARGAAIEGPETLSQLRGAGGGFRHVEESLRSIDKLFWALSQEVEMRLFTWENGTSRPGLAVPEPELKRVLGWLATRYGLDVVEDFEHELQPGHKGGPIRRGDVYFGAFRAPDGEVWHCGQDVGGGKYCCYVYCSSPNDSLTEGH